MEEKSFQFLLKYNRLKDCFWNASRFFFVYDSRERELFSRFHEQREEKLRKMEKGLHFLVFMICTKKLCMCVIQFVQISIFKLDVFRFVYTLLPKTNKSLIPWNKLTFPLPTASEKSERGKQNWECKGDLFNFSFSEASCSLLSRFLSLSLTLHFFPSFSWKRFLPLSAPHSELKKKKKIYCRFSFSCFSPQKFFSSSSSFSFSIFSLCVTF